MAISARSDIFQDFEGGPGQIAIHDHSLDQLDALLERLVAPR